MDRLKSPAARRSHISVAVDIALPDGARILRRDEGKETGKVSGRPISRYVDDGIEHEMHCAFPLGRQAPHHFLNFTRTLCHAHTNVEYSVRREKSRKGFEVSRFAVDDVGAVRISVSQRLDVLQILKGLKPGLDRFRIIHTCLSCLSPFR